MMSNLGYYAKDSDNNPFGEPANNFIKILVTAIPLQFLSSMSTTEGLLGLPKELLLIIARMSGACSLVLPDLSVAYDFNLQTNLASSPESSLYEKMVRKGATMKGKTVTYLMAPSEDAGKIEKCNIICS